MLLQFTVENYLSFDGPTTFSMRASSIRNHPSHIIPGKVVALRGAAIYGPNASGKSNLILAIGFARNLVVQGTAKGRGIATRPFVLRAGNSRITKFKWRFLQEGKIWSYGLAVEASGVVEEYLYARDESGGSEKKWFERHRRGENCDITFGEALRGPVKSELAARLRLIKKNIAKRPEQPFLTFANENSVEELAPVYNWFKNVLTIVGAESKHTGLIGLTQTDEGFLRFLGEFLKFAGTGIERIETAREALKWEQVFPGMPDAMRADLEAGLAKLEDGEMAFVNAEGPKSHAVSLGIERAAAGTLWVLRLRAIHLNDEKVEVPFPLEWESDGTQRLIHLLPALYGHKNAPMVLIIDELDRRLHTLLTRKFVEMALNCISGSCNQLVFTTHDTNLLDKSLLRRDEIWLVQKEHGATSLTSLAEYDIRSDLDFEKNYLEGRFEAIPYFRGESSLLETLEARS